MYSLDFLRSVFKDLKNIDKSSQAFILDSLEEFVKNFSLEYERSLMSKGKIKKLQGKKEVLYRLRLRSYRVIYKKYDDKLVILILEVSTREGAYK